MVCAHSLLSSIGLIDILLRERLRYLVRVPPQRLSSEILLWAGSHELLFKWKRFQYSSWDSGSAGLPVFPCIHCIRDFFHFDFLYPDLHHTNSVDSAVKRS